MWLLLRALLVLLIGVAPTWAAEGLPTDDTMQMGGPVHGPESAGLAPEAPKTKKQKEKEEAEEEQTEAEKAAEKKAKEKAARVIVLNWVGTNVDYKDGTLQRNIKSRIDRPNAMFFPEVDLYQDGRKVSDRSVVPAMQPAIVPDQNIAKVKAAIAEIERVPWNGMPADAWGRKAAELREISELIWFVDRPELREPLFLLYVQIGRSAENQVETIPPWYQEVGNKNVNYFFYLAATLAFQDAGLLAKVTDPDLNGVISQILQELQQGAYPTLKIDMAYEDEDFDAEAFGKDYEVLFNGLPVEVDDQGQVDTLLGRTDILLRRKDAGFGLSERLEIKVVDKRIYFVRGNARKLMGKDFIDQLFANPNECTPSVDGNILNYLAIYAKIHPKSDIYIAVPKNGNPNKIWIWRYDRPSAALQLVKGGQDTFPVRFAISAESGLMYTKGSINNKATADDLLSQQASSPGSLPTLSDLGNLDFATGYIPINFELRGHWNRLMLGFGTEFGYNLGAQATQATSQKGCSENCWFDYYQTPGRDDTRVIVEPKKDATDPEKQLVYHQTFFNREFYGAFAIVLGKDAGIGLGPRIGVHVGGTNLPYAFQSTLDVGYNFMPPMIKPIGDRVRPFVDADLRGGISVPYKTSMMYEIAKADDNDDIRRVLPLFGLTLGIGTTF